MLYLIEDRDYLKIGYAKNIKDRMSNYKLHNCYAKLLSSKEGSMINEKELHELCKEWHYQGEWFYNVPEVKQIFEEYDSFDESKYIWFKKIVTERYISLRKNKTLPYLSNKDQSKINRIRIDNLPQNLKIWVKCFYEQNRLNDVVDFFTDRIEHFPSSQVDFKIFPNTVVNTTSYMLKMLRQCKDLLHETRTLNNKLRELSKLKKKRKLFLEEENEYWQLTWQLNDYNKQLDKWEYKGKYIDKCIEKIRIDK